MLGLLTALSSIRNNWLQNIPPLERDTWTRQEAEARAWLAGASATTPFLDLIRKGRDISMDTLCNEIVGNAEKAWDILGHAHRGALSHDDRLDCLSMAVGYWIEQMGQDVDKRIEARQEGLLNAELKAWQGRMTTTNLMALNKGQSMAFSFSNKNLGSMTDNHHQHHQLKTWVN